jgi:hypothetical protein
MMDGLFQSVPPEDFFRHRDFRPMVIEAVRGNEKPFLALLAAPGEWDVSIHPILPLYAAYKTNSRDNNEMPPSHWQLVLTAPGREEMVILPWNESDKTPPSEASEATPPPPGSKPKVTYSFDQEWRDVDYDGLPPGPKIWKVVLHAGKFLSNPVSLRIKHGKPEPIVSPSVPLNKKKASDYPEPVRKQFVRTPLHPPAPDHGVNFSKQLARGSEKDPGLVLGGSFAFPVSAAESEHLNLHLFFTADDIPKGMRITLSIPKALIHNDGKIFQGCFNVDLRPYFINSAGALLAPGSLYVTAIRGEYLGEPHLVELLNLK